MYAVHWIWRSKMKVTAIQVGSHHSRIYVRRKSYRITDIFLTIIRLKIKLLLLTASQLLKELWLLVSKMTSLPSVEY